VKTTFAVAVAGVLAALALAPAETSAAVVNNVRVFSGPDATRVVFELSGPVAHHVATLADPNRVVVDLEDAAARAPLSLPEPKGVVDSLRASDRPGKELRVVLELNRAARPKAFLLEPSDRYGHRLVVDLVPGDAATADTAPAAQPVVATAAPPPRASGAVNPAGRDVVIAIDAGHGGEDPGASGRNGAREKDVVLAIAKRVAAEVDAQPGMRAVLVRKGDYFVPHRKRMEIAHEAQADFFMSIHADSYRDSSAKGATVYALSDKGVSDEAALLLAQRENASDLIGGVSLADKDRMLARVLLDLSQSAAISASMAAGQRLITRMAAVTTMRRTQVQQAPFLVLKSPDIPSLLVETAYISNPREEAGLRSPEQQTVLAKALCAGILDYFKANPPQGSYFAHPAAPAARTVKHVIARGETLSQIAARYRVSAASIRRSNSLKSDAVRTGQVLTIPRT
jgi:N-acetylmuramoyl-L-alanine amidase